MQTSVENQRADMPPGSGGIEQQTSETVNRFAATAHQAVDRVAQGADSALRSLRSSSEEWKATGDQSLDRLNAYVREKPLMALGVAVAAGFLLSRLMR